MDRGFFPQRQRRFGGRGHDHWFHQDNIPNEYFWRDTWDMPQNQFPGRPPPGRRPPPWWNQHCPEQEKPYNIGFDNNIRGSYQRRPYHGRYKRSKKGFSKGRGNFQKPSSSPCLVNVMPKKTSEKVKNQPEDSKKFKQDKGNTATSVKKDVPSEVKPNNSQPAEESPSQTASVASPGAAAEESPSGITKVPPHTQSEDIALDKLKNCDATEDLLSQTVSILSPEVSTEDKTPSCSAEVLHNIEEEDSVLQASQSAQDFSFVCSPTAVEIPFLSDNANDDQSEREEIEMIETSAKQNDTEDSEVCVAPALDSSSLPSTLSDIPCVPVLVREKDSELTETSAKQSDTEDAQVCVAPALDPSSLPSTLSDIPCESVLVREKDNELTEMSSNPNDTEDSEVCVAPALDSSSLPSALNDIRCVPVLVREKDTRWAENQRRWAPEDYQEPPWTVNQADQYHKVSECYKDSVSTSISSNEKHNVESLVESKSSFQKIHHSTNSKHSSKNQTSRDLHCRSSRSYGRQDCSSRSSGKRDPSTERQDRSSKLSCRREHSLGSSHKQENSPQRDKHKSETSSRQEPSSQKGDCSPKTSLMQEHGVKATGKRKRTSRSPPKRKQSSRSTKLDRWKEVGKLERSCGCHCHCQQSCIPSRESLWQRCCSPHLTCKIKHLHVSKEISNVYGMPYQFSPERSIADEKERRESRQLVEPTIIEKKKKATSKTERKPSTKKKKKTSPRHLNAEEETNSSVSSWTPKDRSAAVLARKEELEQAYLQVLLNFGIIAMMLVEKEPCMIEAMSSALRANLRKIGDYYECLLKNYIDSLTEAS
ncbi:uncharacterized protein M6D78_006847 isoform 2-T2 [Vipera latastei]